MAREIPTGRLELLTHRPGGPFERLLEIGRRESTLDYVQVRQEATREALAQQVSPGSAVNVREGADGLVVEPDGERGNGFTARRPHPGHVLWQN